MRLHFCVILFLACLLPVFGTSTTPVCRAVKFSGNVNGTLHHEGELYSYSFIVNVTKNLKNSTYPNIFAVSNFQEKFKNKSMSYRTTPFSFGFYDFIYHTKYPSENESYSFEFPNGEIDPEFSFKHKNETEVIIHNFIDVYVADGIVFGLEHNKLNGDQDGCFVHDIKSLCHPEHFICWEEKACCVQFDDIVIPEKTTEICQEFETKTTVRDHYLNTSISFQAYTSIQYISNFTTIYYNVTEFKSLNYNYSYEFPLFPALQDYIRPCEGDATKPTSACYTSVYGLADLQEEYYVYFFDRWNHQYLVQVGEIIRKNGILLKDINKPYTVADPCWKKFANVAFKNATYESSFCCKKFETLPTTNSPSTTTTQQPNKNHCLQYNSQTTVSNDTTYLEVEYKLNSTELAVNILNYFGPEHSSVQIEAYSAFTWGQTCQATVSNPSKLCYFLLPNNFNCSLQMRTSTFPEGFNMLSIAGNNGVLTVPKLNSANPCHIETNPYNYATHNNNATTKFCCTAFS